MNEFLLLSTPNKQLKLFIATFFGLSDFEQVPIQTRNSIFPLEIFIVQI